MEQNTKQTLEDLHSELSKVQLDDQAKQGHLNEVTQAIRATLDEADSPHQLTLRDRLEKAFMVFNTDHPAISSALRNAIDILVEAGF